jgi:hypothetical protein
VASARRQSGRPLKPDDPKLVHIAHRLAAAIDPDSCVVAGALAVAVHGYARATADVDLVSRLPLPEVRKRLAEQGVKTALKRGDVREGDFDCLKGVLEGIEFDILPALVPIDWENAVDVPLGHGETLKVVDLPTLIHLKLRAGGPQDVLDVVMLLQQHPAEVVRAREFATAYGLVAQLESFMESPRIKAKAVGTSGRRARRSRRS